MRRSVALLTLALAASLAGAPPAGSGGVGPPPPDGLLVLGVAARDARSGAYTREWAVVADPRTGAMRRRRLAGGTLCHGGVAVVGRSVVFAGYSRGRAVARALPLTLRGRSRVLGPAERWLPASAPRPRAPLGFDPGGDVLSLVRVSR